MPTLTIGLPAQRVQTGSNLRRWAELQRDPEMAKIEGRDETDRHGHAVMTPPPAPSHGRLQLQIGALLDRCMATGSALTECPISTADGVKTADVAWASPTCMRELGNRVCFPRAPEICVVVLSPRNTQAEIREKTALYFDAGAKEVWWCSASGAMKFFGRGERKPAAASHLCPEFPARIRLR